MASDFDEVYDNYKVNLFIEPCETKLLSACIKKAKESGNIIKIFTENDNNCSPEEIRNVFDSNNINISTTNNYVIYTGKKHVCIYANESGKCLFKYGDKNTFYELFSDKEITFPIYMNKGDCILFKI